MIVYIIDNDNVYIGSRDVNPMESLPRGSIMVSPPAINAGNFAVWLGDKWGIVSARPVSSQFVSLSEVKTTLVKQIDEAVIAVYEKPMALSKEYEAREKAAIDYKAAGYTGVVPPRLLGFATPSGMTPTAAADLVLAMATQIRSALDSLSDLRMRKYEVQNALDETTARTIHTDIMGKIAVIAAQVA